MTAKEIAYKIFYSPATNGKAEGSIEEGEKLIKAYAKAKLEEAAERAIIAYHQSGAEITVDKQSITQTPLD